MRYFQRRKMCPPPTITLPLFAALLFLGQNAWADTITGTNSCGAFSLTRSNGSFSGRICDRSIDLQGTYTDTDIQLNRIKLMDSSIVLRPQRAFAITSPDWTGTIQQMVDTIDSVQEATTFLDGLNLDPTILSSSTMDISFDASTFSGYACDPADYTPGVPYLIHVFDSQVTGDLTVQDYCLVIALSDMNLGAFTVNGAVFQAQGSISASTATIEKTLIGGLVETAGNFTAATIRADGATLTAGSLSTSDLQAAASTLSVNDLTGDGALQFSGSSQVSITTNVDASSLQIAGGGRLSAAAATTDSLIADGTTIVLGTLQTESLNAVNSVLTVTGGISAITGTGSASLTTNSSLTAASIDVISLDAHDSTIAAGTITARSGTGMLTIVNTPLTADRIDAVTLDVTGSLLNVPIIGANYLFANTSEIRAPSPTVTVTSQSRFVDTGVYGNSTITAQLGNASTDSQTVFMVDEGGGGTNPGDTGYPRYELVTMNGGTAINKSGASYGGFGGTAGDLNVNKFVPAKDLAGDPKLEDVMTGQSSGFGLGGFGVELDDPLHIYTAGGRGGGFISLTAADLDWNGTATADGSSAYGYGTDPQLRGGGGGGGSGGSILVAVSGTLSGTGTFQAAGGDGTYGTTFSSGGGGSGGRIRIDYGTLGAWSGQALTPGGSGGVFDPTRISSPPAPWLHRLNNGGPGTVYWKPSNGNGSIVIVGMESAGGTGFVGGSFPNDDIEIRNATVVTNGLEAHSLTLSENAILVADNPRVRLPWPAPDTHTTPDVYSWTDDGDSQLIFPQEVIADPLDERLQIKLAGSLEINSTSRIDISGLGGYSRYGRTTYAANRAGGSHGGSGGSGCNDASHCGPTSTSGYEGQPTSAYGDSFAPILSGFGGFGSFAYENSSSTISHCALGGAGGGALRIIVKGTVQLAGSIQADGSAGAADTDCPYDQGTGGGAGGSVWLSAQTVQGAGTISTLGGAGVYDAEGRWGGGGSGGRIAIYGDTTNFSGQIRTEGGAGGAALDITAETFKGGDGATYLSNLSTISDSSCAALLNADMSLHLPYLSFGGTLYSVDLRLAPSAGIRFELASYSLVTDAAGCQPATLSGDLYLHIPLLRYDTASGSLHLRADLQPVIDPLAGIAFDLTEFWLY